MVQELQRPWRIHILIHRCFEAIAQHQIFSLCVATYELSYVREQINKRGCRLQISWETLPWITIVMAQQGDANGIGCIILDQIAYQRQVPQRLTHLLAILLNHARMQPELRERSLAAIVLGLRNLASMMRESQIRAASMNIDALTEVPHHHSTTLDMPTWPPRPPWALPCWLARSLGLPQH